MGTSFKGRFVVAGKFKRGVRYVGNLTIYFYAKDTVYVAEKNSKITVCVHRWFECRHTYAKNWRPAMNRLKFYNNIEGIYDVIKIANNYDLGVVTYSKPMPEIDEGIEVYK